MTTRDFDATETRDARAAFLAQLEYGTNPVVTHSGDYRRATSNVQQDTFMCENGNGPGGAGNTTRSLTHPPARTGRGLGSW